MPEGQLQTQFGETETQGTPPAKTGNPNALHV
jgi:hypothetical protein